MANVQRSPPQSNQNGALLTKDMLSELLKSSLEENVKLVFAKIEESEKNITSALGEKITTLERKVQDLAEANKELHTRVERLERDQKRKNIVIEGLSPPANAHKLKTTVEEFLSSHVKESITVTDAYQFKLKSGDTKIVARLGSNDQKSQVMRSKKSLPKNIYINDDLSKEDRIMRAKGRHFAKEIAAKGDRVQIRTGTVSINETMYKWNDEAGTFAATKN